MATLQIADALSEKLHLIAQKTHQTPELCAQKALAEFLEDQEDYFLALEAMKKDGPTWTLQEVREAFGHERD